MRRVLIFCLAGMLIPVAASAKTDVYKVAKKCAQGKQKECVKLLEIIKGGGTAYQREVAVRHLEGAVLAEIAKLEDVQALLADVARNDSEYAVREQAIGLLSDGQEELFAEIALHDEHGVSARAAAKRLRDPALLAEVAKAGKHSEARRVAVEKVTDQAMLADIAATDEDGSVRRGADRQLESLKRREKALAQGITVRGVLIEASLGEPLSAVEVKLGRDSQVESITDDQGRFSIEGPDWGEQPLYLDGLDARGPEGGIKITVPESGAVDLGQVEVHSDEAVTRVFGSLCDSKGPASRLPEKDLLMFLRKRKDQGWGHRYELVRWSPPWKAVLCIHETREAAGHYVDTVTNAPTGQTAYKTTWSAHVIRLSDGHTFKKTVTAYPPKKPDYGTRGDPRKDLVAWLKTLQ